jgi:hypothetical protein
VGIYRESPRVGALLVPDKSRLPLFRLSFLAPHDQKYGWEILDWAIRERQFCN